MASPAPSTSRQNSANIFNLLIKAANQKHEDFLIENANIDWSIKRLKEHLKENYPKKPEVDSVRLIYSGRLLHDHWTLKECIRLNTEVTFHTIHLVHSQSNLNKQPQTATNNLSLTIEHNNDQEIENELTPGSNTNASTSSASSFSSSASSASSSSSPSLPASPTSNSARPQTAASPTSESSEPKRAINLNLINSDLNNIYQRQQEQLKRLEQQQQHKDNINSKEQFNQINLNLIKYYESLGISLQNNAWCSTYVQHLALYNYMYSNYLKSLSNNFAASQLLEENYASQSAQTLSSRVDESLGQTPHVSTTPPPSPAQPQPQQQQQQQQQPAAAAAANRAQPNVQANEAGEREDDWLSLLHNAVSFLILFCIIYYYSSFERLVVIFSIAFVLILYHNGWLTLQRRRVNANRNQANNNFNNRNRQNLENQPGDENNNRPQQENRDQEPSQEESPAQPPQLQPQSPNFLRLFVTFILTFFTSLVPERPRMAN